MHQDSSLCFTSYLRKVLSCLYPSHDIDNSDHHRVGSHTKTDQPERKCRSVLDRAVIPGCRQSVPHGKTYLTFQGRLSRATQGQTGFRRIPCATDISFSSPCSSLSSWRCSQFVCDTSGWHLTTTQENPMRSSS
jgi:hypothetical protein